MYRERIFLSFWQMYSIHMVLCIAFIFFMVSQVSFFIPHLQVQRPLVTMCARIYLAVSLKEATYALPNIYIFVKGLQKQNRNTHTHIHKNPIICKIKSLPHKREFFGSKDGSGDKFLLCKDSKPDF